MKFRCDPKKYDRADWNTWFAWYPVRHGPFLYWLCFIDRKGTFHDDSCGGCWAYEYRETTWYP